MKKIRYIAIIIFCIAFLTTSAIKPKIKKIEFGINGFFGLSGLAGSIPGGNISAGMGYQFSVDGKYFFSPNWGAGIGVGYSSYSSNTKLDNYTSSTPAIDDLDESFEYRVTASGIKEKLKLSAVEIPVFLAYRKKVSPKLQIQGSFGLKASMPISATYQCSDGTIETRGYYPVYDVEFFNMPNHGFEKIDKISYSGDLTTSMAFSLFAEAGVLLPVGKVGLNLGIYGSYGLGTVVKSENNQLITYPGNYNSNTSLAEKVSLVAVGIKVGVRF